MERLIVTGSDGFIGRYLKTRLERENYEIVTFSLSGGQDIRRTEDVLGLPKATAVFHLAANTNVPFSFDHPQEVLETNILGTLNILEYCRTQRVKMIFPSTAYVYGVPKSLPIKENHPLDAPNAYVESKISGERLCQLYSRCFGIKTIVLRLFNVYGPGQSQPTAINDMIISLLKEGEIRFRDGSPKRDFVFIDDVIEALTVVLDYEPKNGLEVFNVGSGQSCSISELAEMLKEISGNEKVRIIDEKQSRPGDVREVVADIGKINQTINWKPKVSIHEGLERTFLARRESE